MLLVLVDMAKHAFVARALCCNLDVHLLFSHVFCQSVHILSTSFALLATSLVGL